MTNDNKHEDKDRKKVSDEELKAVVGGARPYVKLGDIKGEYAKPKKKPSSGIADPSFNGDGPAGVPM